MSRMKTKAEPMSYEISPEAMQLLETIGEILSASAKRLEECEEVKTGRLGLTNDNIGMCSVAVRLVVRTALPKHSFED